jgi:hypothetical protein
MMMRLSAFDKAGELVGRLRKLEAARDAAQYESVTCSVAAEGRHYAIADLTCLADVRKAIIALLDKEIADVRRSLVTSGVDLDE